ncbi:MULTISPECIES: methionine ABC transporter ATP-binding protein [Sutcliffiella]|uniref:Methionine ABC transporter ATP-binding protein n=1 Tax=Sutcliffiella cohnii TaxID=33932 RepID=A0A223KVA2_9BACI|nr:MULTISPECIES: methionine ABC transporter ATP-binding protein [Sutcliffiella]AST93396.1 methionine ABC transporter ATP-binding protein [Sutcliffiella cohnii]MED4014502.1 methionine ABC transporter ATP-binding protein [Sutcliffiella cohnii]WBL14563.1 methionine ABC transporter ATP-binding protein [Sutcliffiella sp. NC1]
MIELSNITKTFVSKKGKVEALKNVSLNVRKGEIFGVIGYSGAGKSTLIRCVNLLEEPTSGTVKVDGEELTSLSAKQLLDARRKIGMIFQGFNLLKTATVYENIAIPLKLTGVPKNEIKERVEKYLTIVGLMERKDAYPAQLSGGQKQRVAIARALAFEPSVLLSDEATSALDPDTTEAILELLLKINKELGITILLITHEMHVIQKICDRVAVMENGEVVEQGMTLDVFTAPQHYTTKKFVNSIFNHDVSEDIIDSLKDQGKIVSLKFIGNTSKEPALAYVSKKFEVFPNILSGHITHLKGQPFGSLLVHLNGEEPEVKKAIDYLLEEGVQVEGEVNYDVNSKRIPS